MEKHITKPPIVWVLVADAKHAQIYMPELVEHRIPMAANSRHQHTIEMQERQLIPILFKPLSAESVEQYITGRNKTGVVFESFSSARHMAEPHLDARREVLQRFAKRVADFVSDAKDGRAFDRLVLVAPPVMLGQIDAALTENIRRKVTAKVPKELIHETAEVLTQHLKGYY